MVAYAIIHLDYVFAGMISVRVFVELLWDVYGSGYLLYNDDRSIKSSECFCVQIAFAFSSLSFSRAVDLLHAEAP